jgi:hypothetical protein
MSTFCKSITFFVLLIWLFGYRPCKILNAGKNNSLCKPILIKREKQKIGIFYVIVEINKPDFSINLQGYLFF